MVKGNSSIQNLHTALSRKFGETGFWLVGSISNETDAIGWKMREEPRYLFSVSTLAGALPINVFEIEISISDQSINNGDICFNDEVDLKKVLILIEDVLNRKIT